MGCEYKISSRIINLCILQNLNVGYKIYPDSPNFVLTRAKDPIYLVFGSGSYTGFGSGLYTVFGSGSYSGSRPFYFRVKIFILQFCNASSWKKKYYFVRQCYFNRTSEFKIMTSCSLGKPESCKSKKKK